MQLAQFDAAPQQAQNNGQKFFLQMSMTLDRDCRDTKNLDLIPPVSISIPVDPSGAYTGLPHFCSFGSQVRPRTSGSAWNGGPANRTCAASAMHTGFAELKQTASTQQTKTTSFALSFKEELRGGSRQARLALMAMNQVALVPSLLQLGRTSHLHIACIATASSRAKIDCSEASSSGHSAMLLIIFPDISAHPC